MAPLLSSRCVILLLVLVAGLVSQGAQARSTRQDVIWPEPGSPVPDLPGTYVKFQDLAQCPDLSHRESPTSARDVRPDDIKVLIALGDSITAGFLARPNVNSSLAEEGDNEALVDRQRADHDREVIELQTYLAYAQHVLFWPLGPLWNLFTWILLPFGGNPSQEARVGAMYDVPREWRGLSYPIGGDQGAITLPNILSRWTNTTGQSFTDSQLIFPFTSDDDNVSSSKTAADFWGRTRGLNGAISGSTSASLVSQVRDHVLPRMKKMDLKEEEWKFVNIGIGANDICAFCLSPNTSLPLVGTPQEFAKGIKDAVELLRGHAPRLIVNIIGLFQVSALYKLTLKDPYCKAIFLPPLPHLPLECNCALLPGPAGDYTRSKMDELGEAYDSAVLQLVRDWNLEGDDQFAVMWQPGALADLTSWPIRSLSPIDCFHPSEAAHQRVAAGLWNRLTLNLEEKAIPVRWTEEVYVRCLEEDDRFQYVL